VFVAELAGVESTGLSGEGLERGFGLGVGRNKSNTVLSASL
jgi:hypothetical protein